MLPCPVCPVLPGVGEARQDGGDPLGASQLARLRRQQQLHDGRVDVAAAAAALHQVHVTAAHSIQDLQPVPCIILLCV